MIFKSATKLVLLTMTLALCIGLFVWKVNVESFIGMAGLVFWYYFNSKKNAQEDFEQEEEEEENEK